MHRRGGPGGAAAERPPAASRLLASALRRREGSSADASKLGEDRARPGEILLTPGAVSALPAVLRRRLVPRGRARFTGRPMPIARLVARRAGPSAR